MPEQRIEFPSWYNENDNTPYPFADQATLSNGAQTILAGMLLDAVIHLIGAEDSQYLSEVDITNSTVTLWIGDKNTANQASGSFNLTDPPDNVPLTDSLGRSAGLLVSQSLRLASFAAWGVGQYAFTYEQSGFAATVCIPTPEAGVRGVQLPDGTIITGELWLVGGEGVVLQSSQLTDNTGHTYPVITVNATGDPLFRRSVCVPESLFQTPPLLQTITFKDGYQRVVCGPNAQGGIKITVNNDLASDTVLRIRPVSGVNVIEAVGSTILSN